MRYSVFLDTNIIISGIFFEGNESKILDMTEIDLVTCEDVVDELRKVTIKKLKYLGERPLEIALSELERALSDFEIIPRSKYIKKFKIAGQLINHKKDVPNISCCSCGNPRLLSQRRRSLFYRKDKKCY